MAQPAQATNKVQWNDLEINALLDYLIIHRAEGGDGGNFPQETFNKGAAFLNADEKLESVGLLKTGKKLKKTFCGIETYRNQSGCHWDNNTGASIEGTDAGVVWKAYVDQQCHASVRPFWNKGWVFYDKMLEILGTNSSARGRHSFHPASAGPPPTSSANALKAEETGHIIPTAASMGPIGDTVSAAPHASDNVIFPPSAIIHEPLLSAVTTTSQSSSNKRLRTDTFLLDSTDSTSYASTAAPTNYSDSPQLSSLPLSSTLVSSAQPAIKKARASRHSGQELMSSATRAAKITPAAAVMGMQGAINCLTDVLEKSLTTPSASSAPSLNASTNTMTRALEIMHIQDGHLSVTERATLMQIFGCQGNENALAAYISLDGDFETRSQYITLLMVKP
ncbi:hypothetical protein DFH29DRAFT_1003090 [Suillus ampliporus]|nr:hypothetical protein DFH29DRAFT_1003090 [Suillus ampliporus]